MSALPILYSFRRCPYAMRARLTLAFCAIQVELREVVLRDKPKELIDVTPKATVPVLVLQDNSTIDESLDIMLWAIAESCNRELTEQDIEQQKKLINTFDVEFKPLLDRYKYFQRYPEAHQQTYRSHAVAWLQQFEERLFNQRFLMGSELSLADLATFPFIRQFAHVDAKWFDACHLIEVKRWLTTCLDSDLFMSIMKKYPQWQSSHSVCIFP